MDKKRKILIVENDPIQFFGLKNFLLEKGFCVLENPNDEMVSSYDEALETIKSQLPDIAILDIGINGEKDGIDLAKYLQPLNIPVIFLTSLDNDHNLQRAKNLMPQGFIAKTEKPYDERNLWNAINMAMQYVDERKRVLSKGISLKVKEVNFPIEKSLKNEDADVERSKIERIFDWDDILYFYSGTDTPHNYLIIKTHYSSKKVFLYKASLNYFETMVPAFFVRVNGNYLLNARKITHHHLPNKVFVERELFELTKSYNKTAEQKIRGILGI